MARIDEGATIGVRTDDEAHTHAQAATRGDEPADSVARLATCALVREVTLTPKPGLVDERTRGAHTDMDVTTFLASAVALAPHFAACARLGLTHGARPVDDSLVAALRAEGRAAEGAMFAATGGVNTHKGANYSFSLMLAATGMELARGDGLPFDAAATSRVLDTTAAIGRRILDEDLSRVAARAEAGEALSHGERLFLERGVTGVRGEAASGYPALRQTLLPYLRARAGHDANDTLLRAMLLLMGSLEDTNLLHRGGTAGLAWAQAQARRVDAAGLGRVELARELRALDLAFTERNLSPGGTADLLSLGIYFGLLEDVL